LSDSEAGYSSIDYAARRRERAELRSGSSRRRVYLLVIGSVLALVALTAAAEAAVTSGRVHPGVTVSGVAVGGMRPGSARAALRMTLPKQAEKPLSVRHGEQTWEVTADAVGLDFDYDEQVRRAMAVGRDDGIFGNIGDRVVAWTRGVDVEATPTFQTVRLTKVLDRIAEGTDQKPKDAKVKIDGVTPRVVEGEDGLALDREGLTDRMRAAFTSSGSRIITAPVPVNSVRVTADAAAPAAKTAEKMLASPVTVTFKDKAWEFDSEDIARWIAFRKVETTGSAMPRLEAYVSPKKARKPVAAALGTKVGRPAKNARFKTSAGHVTIVPSQDGIGPDIEALSKSLTSVLTDAGAERKVALRTQRTEPEITTDKARDMGIKERISTYTTTFESSNRPRVNNIHLLGDSLDGTLIKPGGVFSFNGAAGQRTAEKGYQEANAIVNGKLVPQLGGGVCQVGTTVFNTVFESGLPVIERRNHSFYISHYPKGRDATVSWGGPDLKFKNSTDDWVLVSVSYTNSSITVSLYGTDPGYKVEAEVGEWTGTKKFSTEEVKDPKMPKGSKVVEDSGITGRSIVVKRIVSKGGKVVRTDSFASRYRPKAQVVRVGTKKVEPEPVEEETP